MASDEKRQVETLGLADRTANEGRQQDPGDNNALLNLPAPLPFDLHVHNLTVGIPDRHSAFK